MVSHFSSLVLLTAFVWSGALGWICRREPHLLMLNGVVVFGMTALALVYNRSGYSLSVLLIMQVVLAALFGLNWIGKRRTGNMRQALKELEEREKRLAQAADLAKLGYYYYDCMEEKVVYCTEQHARSHGLSREEYLSSASTLSNEMPLIHPDDRETLRRNYQEVLRGKQVETSYRVPTENGTIYVREITQPVMDENGRVIAEIATTMDVTDQVQKEHQLLLSQKMETMVKISAGVAHDFNNLLSIVLLNQESLLEKVEAPTLRKHINISIDAVQRGSALAKSLQSFARQSDLHPKIFDINMVLRRVHGWSESFLPANITAEISCLAGIWSIKADPGLTENVILNLMLNAVDAMPEGGKLTIEASNVRVEKEFVAARNETLRPGRYVLLAISDTGSGVLPEHCDRIFEPFFSTKNPAKGSGLGLAMALGFMKQSNGTIRLYSEPGLGSSFNLYFPVAEPNADGRFEPMIEELKRPVRKARSNATTARLLLVEDEDSIREITAISLEQAGYQVVSADTGDKALKLFLANPEFDVLITDVVMPGTLNGTALSNAACEISPNLAVIFLSGYPSEASVHGNVLRAQDTRLQKPYLMADLIDCIENKLAENEKQPEPGS